MSLSESAAASQCSSKPLSLLISNTGGATKILGNMFWINFNHLCCWLSAYFSTSAMFPHPPASTSTALTYGLNYTFTSMRDLNHLPAQQPVMDQPPKRITCWGLRRSHLRTPGYAIGIAWPGRLNSCLPVVSTEETSEVKWWLYPLPQQIQLAQERNLAL